MGRAATALADAARELVRRLDQLGKVSDEPGRLTRTFLSPAMARANALVGTWIRQAGGAVREDAVGNLIGRWEPPARPGPAPRTLLLGSHLDTVRAAGRFDGALGVLLPIAALRVLQARGVVLPWAVEVLGFSEEEGVRFASAYVGSKGYTGTLRAADVRRVDAAGVSVRAALAARRGGPFVFPRAAHRAAELLGYVEVHIEQGPVLEQADAAVGVVSAIAGQTRGRVTFAGRAGHAGTTPMALRRDALAGAAEWMVAVERLARGQPGVVATVGMIEARPGAANVIPGQVTASLDVRHERDAGRRRALRRLVGAAEKIAGRRGLACTWEETQANDATPCAPALTRLLARSVQAVQGRCPTLASGAGHDGVVLAGLTPLAMLFVRCRDGLSHHPDEFAHPADIGVALEVLVDFLGRLATELPP